LDKRAGKHAGQYDFGSGDVGSVYSRLLPGLLKAGYSIAPPKSDMSNVNIQQDLDATFGSFLDTKSLSSTIMVNESDGIPYLQFSARELPVSFDCQALLTAGPAVWEGTRGQRGKYQICS